MLSTRIAAAAAVIVVAVVLAILIFSTGGSDYTVKADFINAGQIVKGDFVMVSGSPVGKVSDIQVTPNGQAQLTLNITDDEYAPLRKGTHATVRAPSLSGVANRYVDLSLPPGDAKTTGTWADGAVIPTSDTTSIVDLDQLFAVFGPKERKGLQGVLKGSAAQFAGETGRARAGIAALDPYIASSSALFEELDRDTADLRRYFRENGNLLADLATRRGDLAGLVKNLAVTTGALSRPPGRLARAIRDLPGFMRQANSTFVDLRSTVNDVDPLVRESKPVVRKLRPFLAALRPLANDARPTVRDLADIISLPGRQNDLLELTRGAIPLRDIAVRRVRANGRLREGAFPATTRALRGATPELAYARPYAVDLTGWFDDFSHSGVYDANGASSRVSPNINAFSLNLTGQLPTLSFRGSDKNSLTTWRRTQAALPRPQYDKCPGAATNTSVFLPYPGYGCDPSEVPPG